MENEQLEKQGRIESRKLLIDSLISEKSQGLMGLDQTPDLDKNIATLVIAVIRSMNRLKKLAGELDVVDDEAFKNMVDSVRFKASGLIDKQELSQAEQSGVWMIDKQLDELKV